MSRVLGGALAGVDGVPVEVEVRLSAQLPRVDIVGLPEAAVRESAARVRSAIASIGHVFPDRRVTVNLAPAGIRKSSAGLDLPIAVGILAASGALGAEALAGLGLVGELALDGRLRAVRGALPQVLALHAAGCERIVAPVASGPEVALAPGAPVELAASLSQVVEALVEDRALPRAQRLPPPPQGRLAPDLGVVRGQQSAKRAIEVSAAGGHGLLMRGAPGAGKTLLARVLPGLLPPLQPGEALEVTRIWSAAGLLDPAEPLALERPFRAPHHSATRAGLLGGGTPARPGEVSLSHHGVLFLDELPEFERRALESLRQVLEDGQVVLSRAGLRMAFPARFQLVAAANPCKCGWFRSGVRDCRCDEGALARYDARLSGPLLDRIDVHIHVRPVPFRELSEKSGGEGSAAVAARIAGARERQAQRLARIAPGLRSNAAIPVDVLDEAVAAGSEARALLGRAVQRLGMSARAAHRTMRVARTLADLAGEDAVGAPHMAEAISFRREG